VSFLQRKPARLNSSEIDRNIGTELVIDRNMEVTFSLAQPLSPRQYKESTTPNKRSAKKQLKEGSELDHTKACLR